MDRGAWRAIVHGVAQSWTQLRDKTTGTSEGELFFKNCIIYLFLSVLDLPGCVGFALIAASRGYSLVAVHGLLVASTSLAAEYGL